MVDSDVAQVAEFNRGISSGHMKNAHQEGMGFSAATLLRREALIPESMRKTTQANLKTRTLKAFRNIFTQHNNANAKIFDWVSYIPVDFHTQVRARIRSVVDPKTDTKHDTTAAQVDSWQDMDL